MKFCYHFSELSAKDIALAGGKGANLGEMTQAGVPVPPGFVIASDAYSYFLQTTNLEKKIADILDSVDYTSPDKLLEASSSIKALITSTKVPTDLEKEIINTYIQTFDSHNMPVAVRSSATAEDLPEASFAGQQETFLNVVGADHLIIAVRKCWASLFEARAIFYRHQQGFEHAKVKLAIPVQQMVAADSAGIMFTQDPTQNDPHRLIIEAGFGLGQPLVSGEITPAIYAIDTKDISIIKTTEMIQPWLLTAAGKKTLSTHEGSKPKLPHEALIKLAKLGIELARHYGCPQDIEWVYANKKIYIVQTRPITTQAQQVSYQLEAHQKLETLMVGKAASPGVATGTVKIVKKLEDLESLKQGDILVSAYTSPDFVTAMKKVAAIVTDQGGITSHAAIVSRELGIPCIVGTDVATSELRNGMTITIDGYTGHVYNGTVAFKKIVTTAGPVLPTTTHVYLNLADPEQAQALAALPADGIGLLRNEFMISQLGMHPKEFIKLNKQQQFVDSLVEGLTRIAQPFGKRPVVYRASDFKSNEYAHLKGGQAFEPQEENPFLGYRGAARYVQDTDVFALELEALAQARKKCPNIWLMIPFVRSTQELMAIKKLIQQAGLKQSETFKLWIMVETPANVITLSELLAVGIDGISIGSNDLTMLTLGVDRDNQRVSHLYNEADPAVVYLMKQAIETCKKHGVTSSVCGQIVSNNMDVVRLLVEAGITSVSVNKDALSQVRQTIHETENKLRPSHATH